MTPKTAMQRPDAPAATMPTGHDLATAIARAGLGTRSAATCPHWQELPPKYGPNAWELRVWDDHWYRVFGTRIVLCPLGVGHGVYASTDDAKRVAERMYGESLRRAVERASRTTLQANAGLAMLRG